MRNRLSHLVVLIAFAIVSTFAGLNVSLAQSVDFGSTPETNTTAPEERGSAESAAQIPQFGMVAVGDHPTGYFDNVEVAPGSSVELTSAIVNSGQVPVSLRTYKVNALSGVNGGFLSGKENDAPMGATNWIDYPPFDLELAPGESREVTFTVTVPDGTAPGQYISGLIAVTSESSAIEGSDLLTQSRGYAISVGILVPGDMTPAFEVGEPVIDNSTLTIPVINTGNYLVRPAGEMTLTNQGGEVVHTSAIQMGSVYAGLETMVQVPLPEQTPPGEYLLNLSLLDEASGASTNLVDSTVVVPEPTEPGGVSATVDVEPNADPIAYANVTFVFNNAGNEIPAAEVVLIILRDGELVEEFPLESNLRLPAGETTVDGRYIPANDWETGTYTFQMEVTTVDRQGENATTILVVDATDEIIIP